MKALVKKSLFRTFLFCAYSILGSLVFHYVERKPICHKEMSFKMLEELHRKYNVSLNQSEFTEFANDVFRAVKVGKKVDWTFLNASSYVFTILTTIGEIGKIIQWTSIIKRLMDLFLLMHFIPKRPHFNML